MNELTIKSKIHIIRGKQVMLDRDLAELYYISTKVLNQAVKRNIARFPNNFMFQLTKEELEKWKSQIVTSNKEVMGLRKRPYVFTEQGVAMLSAVIKSNKAIQISIQIMDTFIQMRKFLQANSDLFQKISSIETKQIQYQIKTDEKFEEIFNLIQERDIKPEKGIFYDGEIYKAHIFITKLISEAKESIILIDNFVDENTLTLFSQTKVKVIIYTKSINAKLSLALKKYNQQYNNINIIEFDKSHDRFLIIDEKEIYHVGASLKDVGKKWFAFSKFEDLSILERLK